MKKIEKNPYTKWEISIIELKEGSETKFKVTRRMPELNVAETKIFKTKEEAVEQFNEWLK